MHSDDEPVGRVQRRRPDAAAADPAGPGMGGQLHDRAGLSDTEVGADDSFEMPGGGGPGGEPPASPPA
jgi:hypothetical protein